MSDLLHRFWARHPILRQTLLWAIPAVLFGAVLRGLMLSYLPYAYWGSDSNSYFSFAHKLLTQGYISLDEKRRFFYPILMVPVSILPGSILRWLAWLQHGFGLLTLLPLAYAVRKGLVHWRWWIVPVTVIYAGMPVILWYEHELLGETMMFAGVVWAFAGWCAWISEERRCRAHRLFWWFFVPFTLVILTKPSARFLWPGLLLGLVAVQAWRRLARRHLVALGLLLVMTLFVGSKKQGAWLLYVATFPLTNLETPLHREYKDEIRSRVEPLREHLDAYYLLDGPTFAFLEHPSRQDELPLFKALDKDSHLKSKIYMDLAKEAILSSPGQFLYLGAQRVIASANVSEFKEDRFTGEFYVERFEHFHAEALVKEKSPVRMLFALPKGEPIEPYSEFSRRISPCPDSWMARTVQTWVAGFERVSDLVRMPEGGPEELRSIRLARPTWLGLWLCAGIVLALLPRYHATLGVWMMAALSYLFGVFLFAGINPRYFGTAWPVLIPLLAVPADALVRLIVSRRERAKE